MENNWLEGNTLGGKEKLFWWNYDGEKITIKKKKKDKSDCIIDFFNCEIDMLIEYIKQSERVPLANNIQKLQDGTEKDGIGKYIYNNIIKNNDKAQSASQFVSIFLQINILGYNGKKSNMEFWVINMDWKERILEFTSN